MRFVYNLSVYFYYLAIRVASFFNDKARLWINGRKKIFENLRRQVQDSRLKAQDSGLVWVHCASLGEFEQGRPLIEKLKVKDPELKILLTFFSPSGYEIRKNYSGADYIFYLPIDTPANAKKFIELIKPKMVFFIKYEFWFNYLDELKHKNIPTYLVSGIFREEQYFFRSYGFWFRKQLSAFSHFYLQDEISVELLRSINYNNVTLAGDTRFDRVFEIAQTVKSIPLIEQFKDENDVLIAGSTWPEDEKIISDWYLKTQESRIKNQEHNYKLIIVPHEIDEQHIQSIIDQFSNAIALRYSQTNSTNVKDAQVLIIDNIGMLSSLYQYGSIAFIGGGFGKGIHNILEAATFGLPIMFGTNYQKFQEAKELIHLGGAFSINDVSGFEKTIQLLDDKLVLQTASHGAKYYVQGRVGATDKILSSILN
jgi:3-deoxy-D-manno-octulosonic-acid transferase